MNDKKFQKFNLAGGTALALHIGHRISIDLDMFSSEDFDAKSLETYLIDKYNFKSDFIEKNTLKGSVRGVKIDCISLKYPLVKDIEIKEKIRMYSIEDISAMKLSAITDNGTRVKDFIDIAFLSKKLTLSNMIDAYKCKYKNSNPFMAVKALCYFKDINFKEPVRLTDGVYNWNDIEMRIRDMVKKKNHKFLDYPVVPSKKRKGLSI